MEITTNPETNVFRSVAATPEGGVGEARGMELTCEVFDCFAPLEKLREAWDELAIETRSPVFLSFDWVKLWWEFYGGQKRLRIYVCHADKRLVAVIPLCIESLGFGPLGLRVARIVGANVPPHVFSLPIIPEWAEAVYGQALDHLFGIERCHVLSFGLVSENCSQGLAEACALKAARVGPPKFLVRDVSTTFHLPPTYEEYLKSLDGKERKIRRKKLRDLESERDVRVEVVQDDTHVIEEFEQFVEQHTRQWQSEGRPGHFGAWPRALEFHRALVATLSKSRRVRLVKLLADDVVVANQYTFTFGDAIYALLPARVTGHPWERFSLGGTSQVKLIESSIEDGFERLESGLGHYDYKVLLNGRESPAGVLRVTGRGAWVRGKVRLFEFAGELLSLLLHKIWYRRIAPKMFKRRSFGRPAVLVRYDF